MRRLATFNHALIEVERNFLLPNGLPNRAWFRYAFDAPGVYTGYETVVVPAVREAAGRKDWPTAAQQPGLVQGAIERGTVTLTQTLQSVGEGGLPLALRLVGEPSGLPQICGRQSREGKALPYQSAGGQ
jgi:hypothetical protein